MSLIRKYLFVLFTVLPFFSSTASVLSEFASKVCGMMSGDIVVTVPEGVTDIPDYAFADCSSLKEVTLPEGLKTIGDYAFLGCTGIEVPSGNAVPCGALKCRKGLRKCPAIFAHGMRTWFVFRCPRG